MGLVLIFCYIIKIRLHSLTFTFTRFWGVMCVWINVEFGKAGGAVNTTKERVLSIIFTLIHSFRLQS